jgi:Leucine-rich repeat (LRR) protein
MLALSISFAFAQDTMSYAHRETSVIPYALRGKKDVQHLDLSYTQIRTLPSWLSELKQLKSINLSGVNTLHPVDAAKVLSTCTSLENVIWNDARLLYIPVPLMKCKKLNKLEVANNAITEIPKNINQVPLKYLNIANNLIDSLPDNISLISELKQLDFSFNPGIANSFNYQLLSELPQLTNLKLEGAFFLPEEVGRMKRVHHLSLKHSNFANLPAKIIELKALKSIDLYGCRNLKLDIAIEQLEACHQLTTLSIGHPLLQQIPFNIIKLKHLQTLKIRHSCFDRFPNSFKKLRISTLDISHSKINDPVSFFSLLEEMYSIKTLKLNNMLFGKVEWEAFLGNLDTLSIRNCGLSQRHFSANKVGYFDGVGNEISSEGLRKVNSAKHNITQPYHRHSYGKKITANKVLLEDSSLYTFKKRIYASVGEIVDLPNGLRLNIPGEAFLDKNGKVIQEEVDLHCTMMMHPSQYLDLGFPLWDQNRLGLHFLKALKIEVYYLNEKAYINQKKPIQCTYDVIVPNDWKAFKYDFFQKRWETQETFIDQCKIDQDPNPSDQFKAITLGNPLVRKSAEMTVKRAPVYLKLKHNRRRKTLNFDLEPAYSYLPSYLPGVNQNVFAFPDLKVYKNIRWNYMGDSLLKDLHDLVILDPEARPEKIGRKSTFSFTTTSILDIYVHPDEKKDYYLMNICLPQDTLQIPVLPALAFTQPKKIQKWHQKRYQKYTKLKEKRYEKWGDLDSSFFKSLQRQQYKIEAASKSLRDTIFSNPTVENDNPQVRYRFNIDAPGWYGLARNLNFNNLEKHSPKFSIGEYENFSKFCLVYDIDKGVYYWSKTKEIPVEKNSRVFVYVSVGDQYNYAGPLNKKDNEVQLEKLKFDEK